MSVIARQSTARTVIVGPVLDADGAAVANAAVGDFKISKNGGEPAALNASATLTHRNTGHYSLGLTADDLNTVGQAEVVIDKSTDACPQKVITVVEEAVYDALFASGATGKLPATLAAADVTNIDNFKADVSGVAEKTDLPTNFSALGINASGHVSRVVLVDTTTANTDMRGTDNAALATEVAKIPRVGQTHRWTNTDSSVSADVEITEAPG